MVRHCLKSGRELRLQEIGADESIRLFHIDRKISEGASCVCYEAHSPSSGKGILKEFYPVREALGLERHRSGQLLFSEDTASFERFAQTERRFLEPYELLLQLRRESSDSELVRFIPLFEIYRSCAEIADGAAGPLSFGETVCAETAEGCRPLSAAARKTGTVYIWSPEPQLQTFDVICGQIRRHPDREPEHLLVTVLLAMQSLTKGILELHKAGLIHRDIKPSNFGFLSSRGETLTQTLSLFDVDTVCRVEEPGEGIVGTPGYLEPEALSGRRYRISNQTDIYAIGAVLFQAVVITEETAASHYLYQPEYQDRLPDLVRDSALIRASEANSHPKLRFLLASILRRCLAPRAQRYAGCEELLDDLNEALFYALPSEAARRSRSGGRWVLKDIEESLDRGTELHSTLAIQAHLYQVPLYAALPERAAAEDTAADREDAGAPSADDHAAENAKDTAADRADAGTAGAERRSAASEAGTPVQTQAAPLQVLVIGFGNYGQKFLDVCLQAGQMPGRALWVTVVSGDAADEEIYLSERPALGEFFRIIRSGDAGKDASCDADAYGRISFLHRRLDPQNTGANAAALSELLHCGDGSRRPQYIFIALGSDSLNLKTARICRKELGTSCAVSCIREDAAAGKTPKGVHVLDVHEDMGASPVYAEIERMAFNVHLIWEKNLNVDLRSVRAQFRSRYNHDSCVSNVLSLKYKLFGIGIDLDRCTADQAAAAFAKFLASEETKGLRQELIWIEHRRWVTEKICLGWSRMEELDGCLAAEGRTKDERTRRHVCIVRSRPDQALADAAQAQERFWDEADEEQLAGLDELDRLSVRLHRVYAQKAAQLGQQGLPGENDLKEIRRTIEGRADSIEVFQEWEACIRDIYGGDREKLRLYKGRRQAFLAAVSGLSKETRDAVKAQTDLFDRAFWPIRAGLEYRDWKKDDVALVDNIPFILTYSTKTTLIIPLQTGGIAQMIADIAAPTLANPCRIIYLSAADSAEELSRQRDAMSRVCEYLRRKRAASSVEWTIGYTENVSAGIRALEQEEWVRVYPIAGRTEEDFLQRLHSHLAAGRRRGRIIAAERNETALSGWMADRGLYDDFAAYRFDAGAMAFTEHRGCDLLAHIHKRPYLTVSDLRILSPELLADKGKKPAFAADWRLLHGLYEQDREAWRLLCEGLRSYTESHDVIAVFQTAQKESQAAGNSGAVPAVKSGPETLRYLLPAACLPAAEAIARALRGCGAAGEGSRAAGFGPASCEVIIEDISGQKTSFDRLFSDVYALMIPGAVSAQRGGEDGSLRVVFADLRIEGAVICAEGKRQEVSRLLGELCRQGFLLNLRRDSGPEGIRMSAVFAAQEVRDLLTAPGRMREVYLWHSLRETDAYDDMENTAIAKEGAPGAAGFAATKGFRAFFLPCAGEADSGAAAIALGSGTGGGYKDG